MIPVGLLIFTTSVSGYFQSGSEDFYKLYETRFDYGDFGDFGDFGDYGDYGDFSYGDMQGNAPVDSVDRNYGDLLHTLGRTNLDNIDLAGIYSSLTSDSNVLQQFIKRIVVVRIGWNLRFEYRTIEMLDAYQQWVLWIIEPALT